MATLSGSGWRTYAAPVAVLLAVTILVLVVRSVHDGGKSGGARQTTSTTHTTKHHTSATPAVYTVKPGDTYAKVAARTGVAIATLKRLNPGAATALFIGEKLKLR